MGGLDSVLVVAMALHPIGGGATQPSSFAPPAFVTRLPCFGSESAPNNEVYGLRADGSSAVYVADYLGGRILKFDFSGNLLVQWGSSGDGPGQLGGPHDIAIGPGREVYVAEDDANRVSVFTSSGTFLRQIGGGLAPPFFYAPTYLCVTPEGTLLVSDSQNQRIQEVTSDGVPVRMWGGPGSSPGQFAGPRGIAMDASGKIFVCDEGNKRVEVFSRSGAFLWQWAIPWTFQDRPPLVRGIRLDEQRVYVTDRTNNVVDVFTTDGSKIGSWATPLTTLGEPFGPNAIDTDPLGHIYVGGASCQVQVFGGGSVTAARKVTWGMLKRHFTGSGASPLRTDQEREGTLPR